MYPNRFHRGRGGGRGFFRGAGGRRNATLSINPSALVDRRFAMQPLPECLYQMGIQNAGGDVSANYPPTQTRHFCDQKDFPQDRRYFCDRCFRGYNTDYYFRMHLKNHVKCIADGCLFEGLPRVVAKHLLTFHTYNLPTGAAVSKSAIHKWLLARKRNFPSQDVIESKERRDEARMERGEVLETRNAFGKFKLAALSKRKRKRHSESDSDEEEEERPGPSRSHQQGQSARVYKEQTEGTNELIEKLLADEIRHERNVLLQCIRYILNHKQEFGIGDVDEIDQATHEKR